MHHLAIVTGTAIGIPPRARFTSRPDPRLRSPSQVKRLQGDGASSQDTMKDELELLDEAIASGRLPAILEAYYLLRTGK
jgi:hypothetical protein